MSFEIVKCSDADMIINFQDQLFADFDEVELKVVQGKAVKGVYTKTGGDITAGVNPNEAALTIDASDTCKFNCGEVFFQIKTVIGTAEKIELSDKGTVINSY
jgi:hypothetical protein